MTCGSVCGTWASMASIWPETGLAKVCTSIVGSPTEAPTASERGVFLIRTEDVGDGHLYLRSGSFSDEEQYAKRTARAAPEAGDLVVTLEKPVGEVAIVPPGVRFSLGPHLALVRPDQKKVQPEFLSLQLRGHSFKRNVLYGPDKQVLVDKVSLRSLRAAPIVVPPLDEQRRIVSTLEPWERLIGLLRERLSIEQTRKHVLMERLFAGEVRFDASSASLWRTCTLGQLGHTVAGRTPPPARGFRTINGAVLCTTTDVAAAEARQQVFVSGTGWASEARLRSRSTARVPRGALIICTRGPIGACAVAERPMVIGSGCVAVIPECADVEFLCHVLRNLGTEVRSLAKVDDGAEISVQDLANLTVRLPGLKDQQDLGALLRDFECLVDALRFQLSLYRMQRERVLFALLKGRKRTEWLNR